MSLALLTPLGGEHAAPSQAVTQTELNRIDRAVETAIGQGALPGAVVLVRHRGQTVYHKAFGHRALVPTRERMTLDTVFDLASLTKVVVSAPGVMMLVDDGLMRLEDPVAHYLPGFERHGKHAITIRQLLTHVSGLRPDFDLEEEFDGYAVGVERALAERPVVPPGERFIYSDINFILLGEVIARVSGQPLDEFAARRVFEPLGMGDTRFRPGVHLGYRIAPTEPCRPRGWPCGTPGAPMLRGVVHDPTARRMAGVAGHAGVFGTAADLALLGQMFLAGGVANGNRLLATDTVAQMTSPATPPGIADRRGLGWDIDSRYSGARGDLFSTSSYGHTGFTGTSIWIDPVSETIVVLLTNRVHPTGQGDVRALRREVATLAAAALTRTSPGAAPPIPVATGVDVLREEQFARLRGRRVGLLTNHTGQAADGVSTIELLRSAAGVRLAALFAPEHGMLGTLDTLVPDGTDPATGLPVYSLYGDTRRPTAQMLDGLDVIVVDLQTVGVRFYTYATTMAYVMEEAAAHGVQIMVLDRPNPITGTHVEGPMLDPDAVGFTGYVSIPIRHGLTLGELARFFNDVNAIGAELEVVQARGWQRSLWFDGTGLPWVNPSPNLRTVTQAILYPGIGSIEGTNLSVGRGTDTPFEVVGAPWIDGVHLARALNSRALPGVRFYPVRFRPETSKYAGERCGGVHIIVTDRTRLQPVRVGLEIAAALYGLYGERFELDAAARLLGSRAALERVRHGDDPAVIAADWMADEQRWRERRASYLLYD